MTRVIALGASNLTRGLRTLRTLSRTALGRDTQILAALGLGRSYGAYHRLGIRGLPGILDCGLWTALDALPPAERTLGIVSDIGNDILYGFPPEQILSWVREVITRLERHTTSIALTGLPIDNPDRVTPVQFRIMRTIMFPSSRQTLDTVKRDVAIIHPQLERLAAERGIRFVRLKPEWYGLDPVHFRYPYWRRVWGEFLGLSDTEWQRRPEPGGFVETVRLWARADEHRWLCGVHQHTRQDGSLRLY